jgi:hypothetical protein
MHPDIPEPKFVFHQPEMILPVGTKAFIAATGADTFIVNMLKVAFDISIAGRE